MWFIGVEVVEQETSAPPPKKNPGSAPVMNTYFEEDPALSGASGKILVVQLSQQFKFPYPFRK